MKKEGGDLSKLKVVIWGAEGGGPSQLKVMISSRDDECDLGIRNILLVSSQ